jgi:uncharacterized protein YjbI with pentapeptide repeats
MSALSLRKGGYSVNRFISGMAWGIVFLGLLLALAPRPARGAAPAGNASRISEQEAWVLKQVKEGSKADLEKEFGREETKRRLRAAFLKKLLMKGFKDVRIPHQGVHIAHAVITGGPLDLQYLDMDYPLTLSNCLFPDQVIFNECHCTKDVSLAGSTFLQDAHFRGIKVNGNMSCDHAVFERTCVLTDANIGEKFQASEAEFRSPEHKADFRTMRVGTEAYFTSAKFYGPVDFGLAHIGVRLNMDKAEFFYENEPANFLAMMVDKYALFNGARFHGPANFVLVQVGLQFVAGEAEFLSTEGLIDFRGIKTGNTIYFAKAQFMGPVQFEFSEIGANFRASGARFLNACQAKTFAQMKVGQKVFLDGVTTCCDFDLSYGEFHDVEVSGVVKDQKSATGSTMNLAKLNLTGAQVQRELKIADASIGELLAGNVQVKGPTRFNNVKIRTLADFRHSSFQDVDLQRVVWPAAQQENGKDVRQIRLSELTYNSLNIGNRQDKKNWSDYNEGDFKAIVGVVDDSPFNTQMYVQLETFFKRIGKEEWANRVYIYMHDRNLEENLYWWDPIRWLEWLFWGRLAGYGKKPFRVFFISLVLVSLGACLFDPEYLKDNKKSHEGRLYKSILIRIFLSLDRFLPIDLGLAKNWDAKANRFPVWFYFHLQQVLGWVLIPIALASIYTQIK